MKTHRMPALLLLLLVLNACASSTELKFTFIGYLPVFYVVENRVNPVRAKALADALGISVNIIASDGSIRYLDKERFQALPMLAGGVVAGDEENNPRTIERFNFEAIKAIKPFENNDAMSKAKAALQKAELSPQGGKITIGHSHFQAVDLTGSSVADALLDTHVDFETVTPNGYPLKGSGASIKVVFDGQGVVTQLQYAFRTLKEGSRASLVSPQQARVRAAVQYFGVSESQVSVQGKCAQAQGQVGALCIDSELVYYAPPMDQAVTQILPHYLFSGNLILENSSVNVRNLLVPAVQNPMTANIAMTLDGKAAIQAKATVSGGRAPYRYVWSSSSTTLPLDEATSEISYTVAGREAVTRETLSLVVTDADGISAWTSQALAVDAPAPATAQLKTQAVGAPSVGAEWVGLSQNLPFSKDNANGFLSEASKALVKVAFNYGEDAAQQRDFAKATDDTGVEKVDMAFYTGHASGLGFSFQSLRNRRLLVSEQASWGEGNLEWIVIAACGPLQEKDFGIPWWQQWGKAFNGLHLMLAYANTTFDNNREGRLLGQEVFAKGLPLRQAWASTASDVQTPSEIYALMGVFDESGLNNYNDHFWGFGPTGPDIPAINVKGYWRLSGPS